MGAPDMGAQASPPAECSGRQSARYIARCEMRDMNMQHGG